MFKAQILKKFKEIDTKNKQIILTVIIGVIVICVFGAVLYLMSGEEEKKQVSSKRVADSSRSVNIESAGKRVNPEEVWRYRMEQDKQKLESNIKNIRKELESAITHKANKTENKEVMALRDEVQRLGQVFNQSREGGEQLQISAVQKFTLNLKEAEVTEELKTYKNTIGAGAFVKAVLLGGIDASTAMSSSSDPRPILLRLMNEGTLPRKFKSDLKDCHVIASGYGDISSERVYARLEKLTCTVRSTGEIIETDASGYVAGEDGKVGIRGAVVSKEGALLANSFFTGMFGGISKILGSQGEALNPLSDQNKFLKAPSEKDQFKKGFGTGAGSAVEKLSQYYIDRAEQIQPVVQVSSGRLVDIVFTKSVSFGERIKTGSQEGANK